MISDLLEVPYEDKKTVWATVAEENSIYIFNSGNFDLATHVSLPNNSTCFGICLHHQYVLIGSTDKVFIFERNGEQIGEWKAHCGSIRFLFSSPEHEERLWTAAGSKICVWDLSVDGLLTLKKLKEISAHDTRITAMKLLKVPHVSTDECGTVTLEDEVWTSSYDYNCLFWNTQSFHPHYEMKLPHCKELIRCFAQYHNQVFMGSSYRDSDDMKGNLYMYNFDVVLSNSVENTKETE